MPYEAGADRPGMIHEGRRPPRRGEPFGSLRGRIAGLLALREPLTDDLALAARLLKGVLLASLPILMAAFAVRLAFGKGVIEPENFILISLTVIGLVVAFMLRFGWTKLSGFVLTFALWAAGAVVIWMPFGFWGFGAILMLLAVLIACLVSPWIRGTVLTVLSISAIWLLVALESHGLRRLDVPNPVDTGFALTAFFILVSFVALVCGRILHSTVRQTVAAQKALSRSEKELSSILQRTPDIIYCLDAEGRITYVNEAVRRYGYDPSKMVGTHVLDYVHPDDRDLAWRRLDERHTGDRRTNALEIRLLTPLGTERVAECAAAPISQEPILLLQEEGPYEDGTGPEHYIGTQGIARDITDRKRAEDALKKSEEKYSKVFQAAPAGVVLATLAEGRFLEVNEEAERIFGFQREEVIGHTSFEIGVWADPGDRERIIALMQEEGVVKSREVRFRAKGGDLRTVRYSAQRIDIEGRACLISTLADVTDRKILETQLQQAQKLEAVGRLAGGIAHDFNNMLAVILGQADIASQDLPPGHSVQESIKEIRKAAQGSAELTRQLLTFARRREAAPRVLDLNQAISERLGMLQHLIGENVTLNWRPGPDLWPARMDLAQIDQILINLSVNARDAIVDAGELTISTENQILQRAGPDGPRSEWVVLTVQDTGTGMSEEIKAHLFEPFFTTKEIGKGTGMGLASVYGVVRQCGGWIDVTSELGRGTRFRIYLPRAAGMLPAAQDSVRQPLAPGGETVLVVEDMPAILKIVQLSLRSLGYTVLEAASPEEALSVLAHRTGPVQLLLTDVVMPGMNGLDLYRQVAAAHPETKVIYMSGYSDSVLPQRDAAEGDVRFLHKPFSLQELSAKIREILDKH